MVSLFETIDDMCGDDCAVDSLYWATNDGSDDESNDGSAPVEGSYSDPGDNHDHVRTETEDAHDIDADNDADGDESDDKDDDDTLVIMNDDDIKTGD